MKIPDFCEFLISVSQPPMSAFPTPVRTEGHAVTVLAPISAIVWKDSRVILVKKVRQLQSYSHDHDAYNLPMPFHMANS